MNQQTEEGKIRELFQQLRRDDERGARSFADVWNAALSRQGWQGKSDHRRVVWRFAVVTAILTVLSAGWWMGSRPSARRQAPVQIARSERPVDAFPPPAIVISQWRSPTESLLHAPGEQLFKSVPRVDESLVNIETIKEQT